MLTDLTDAEIDNICDGYTQNAARVRYLRAMGLTVRQKPNGRRVVVLFGNLGEPPNAK